jgi:hypothetical protein
MRALLRPSRANQKRRLAGIEGVLRRRKRNYCVVLSVALIMRSMAVEAGASNLDVAFTPTKRSRGPK